MRDVPIHYLRPNEKVWTPPAVAFLDTETRTLPDVTPDTLALRLWVARFIDRRPPRSGQPRTLTSWGRTPADLAAWVEHVTKARASTWLFAHNLSFDLVTTRLPLVLAAAGWTINDAAVGGASPWLRLARGQRRLTLVDSGSWLPYPLARIGEELHLVKAPLPDEDDTEAAWLHRCRVDVDILDAAITELMEWWDRGGLGRWTITGAACGWNVMRHHKAPQKFTIDPDPDGVAADRAAIYGGRRGVWRVGHQTLGPFLELDFEAAYPSVAAELSLPIGRKQPFASMAVDDWRVDDDRWGVIARVSLRTDTPRWPLRLGAATFYPTGRFDTVLAGPEIADARRLGALLSIGAGYVHQLGVAMLPWARWCLATQTGQHEDSPPAARLACKAWGRSVIGKWAAHSYEKTELGAAPGFGWGYTEGFDHESQSRGGLVHLGGRSWWVAASGNGDNAYPAVFAWVESAVRVRLSRVIEAVGPGAVVQCDTDGLIVNERLLGTRAARGHLLAPDGLLGAARTAWVLNCLDPIIAPLHIRLKRTVAHVSVIGPQHLALGGQRRLAGIPGAARCGPCETLAAASPRTAEQVHCAHVTDGGTYTGPLWPKLQWQMAHGSPAGYVRPTVTSRIAGPYVNGWVTTTGQVLAPAAVIDADGLSRLAPWCDTPRPRPRLRLTERQHPNLDGLW